MNHLVINDANFEIGKNAIDALKKLELQYVLVRNFFSVDEVNSILKDLKAVPDSLRTDASPGFKVFPRTALALGNAEESPDTYFSTSAKGASDLRRLISVNVANRFNDLFKEINNNKPFKVLYGPADDVKFLPVNFRFMVPTTEVKGTSRIHIDYNITARCADNTYKHLINVMDFENQLSFFCLLQNCNDGGDITIFDLLKDNPAINFNAGHAGQVDIRAQLEKSNEKSTVHMSPGDVILFPGSKLWHRVEMVKRGERISVGGFAAQSHKDGEWYYWI